MKNFRVFNGAVQHVAAERCEVRLGSIAFCLEEIVVKVYTFSEVRKVEELDSGMRIKEVLYPKRLARPD